MAVLESVLVGVFTNFVYDKVGERVDIQSKLRDEPEELEDLSDILWEEVEQRVAPELPNTAGLSRSATSQELRKSIDNRSNQSVVRDSDEYAKQLSEAILSSSVSDQKKSETLGNEIESATMRGIEAAKTEFIKQADAAGMLSQLNLEANLKLLSKINEVENVQPAEMAKANDHFRMYHCEGDENSPTRLFRNTGYANIPFVKRDSLSNLSLRDSRLIIGRKGLGKTRALRHCVNSAAKSGDFDYLIEISESFTVEDVPELVSIDFDGNVLMVCDDIHDLMKPNQVQPFRLAHSRLSSELNQGHQLTSYAAIRAERLEELPQHNRLGEDHVWGGFEYVRLQPLDRDEIEKILSRVLRSEGAHEYGAEKTSEIASKIELTDPSPFYTTAVAKWIVDNRPKLEENVYCDIPDGPVGIWRDQYRSVQRNSDTPKRILFSIKLMRRFRLPASVEATKDIFVEVLGGDPLDFETSLGELATQQWVGISKVEGESVEGALISIHDIQLEAIPELPHKIKLGFMKHVREWEPTTFDIDELTEAVVQIRICSVGRYDPQINHEDLMPHVDLALNLAPDNAAVLNLAGLVKAEAGNTEEGKKYLEKAINSDFDSPAILFNYAKQLVSMGEFEEGIKYLSKVVQEKPNNPVFLHSLGHAYVGNGETERGLNYFNQALSVGGKFGELYFSKADSLNLLGEYEQAETTIETAISQFKDGEQWLNLANSYCLLAISQRNQSKYEDCKSTTKNGLELVKSIQRGRRSVNVVTNDQNLDVNNIERKLVSLETDAIIQMGDPEL